MADRRTFIKDAARAAAGVAFTSCGLLDAMPARAQAWLRCEVMNVAILGGNAAKLLRIKI